MIHFPIITEFSLPSIILIPATPSSQRLEMLRLKFVMTVGFLLRLCNWMCVLIILELISLIIEKRKSCLINRNLVLDGQENEDSVTSETFFKCVCGSVVEFNVWCAESDGMAELCFFAEMGILQVRETEEGIIHPRIHPSKNRRD